MRTGEAIREILQYNNLSLSFLTGGSDSKEYDRIYHSLSIRNIVIQKHLDYILSKLKMDYYDLYVIMEGNKIQKEDKLKEIKFRLRKLKIKKYESVETI